MLLVAAAAVTGLARGAEGAEARGAAQAATSRDGKLRTQFGTLHRCRFQGPATFLDRDNEGGYFGHTFEAKECEGGLPRGRCLSTLHSTYHCGEDEQWTVLGPHEQGGPGMMWFNYQPCPGGIAKIAADYFCPTREAGRNLHLCFHDGAVEKVPMAPRGSAAVQSSAARTGPGRYRHIFTDQQCSNGLPPSNAHCVTALHTAEHCGGDHDWAVGNTTAPSKPGITWFTSHTCVSRATPAGRRSG